MLCGFMWVPLCSCTWFLCCSHSLSLSLSVHACVCVRAWLFFATVCLSIYPHIIVSLSHPLNDAQPHFVLIVLAFCLRTLPIAPTVSHMLHYLQWPSIFTRLSSWMNQTCEVKSGPSSLKGFQASLGLRPSKCIDCWSHTWNRHACTV